MIPSFILGIRPLFYNVIPPESSDSKERGIDPDACRILLGSSSEGDNSRGYNQFHSNLLTLMSCGTDYTLYSENVFSRVTVSTCKLEHNYDVYIIS